MEEFDLRRFAKLAWAKKIYIILIMIISITVGYFYSYVCVIPKYRSTTTLLLAQISDEQDDNTVKQSEITDLSMTSTLLEPYISLIESKKVLEKVISNLELDMTYSQMLSMLNVSEENTAMLSISVSSENPILAEKIANEVANVFTEQSKEIFNITNVNIIDKAERESTPYNINHTKDFAIFIMLGVFLSCGLVLMIYMLDTTIKEEEDIENELNLPVLGTIPVFEKAIENKQKKEEKFKNTSKKGRDSEIVILDNTKSPVAEAFRALRTNVTFAQNTKTILVTSSKMAEGKSYVTANLAATIAKGDKKVILIDADMRKGRQNKIFGVEETKVDISEVTSYIKETDVPNLHLITSGSRPSNPAELLNPPKIKGLLSVLAEIYDIILIDGTPSSIIADSVVISRFVDYTMLITSYKNTKIEDVKRLIKTFEQVGVKLNGAVLNKYPLTKEGYSASYYYNDEKNEAKLEDKEEITEIRSVENFLSEANINTNSFRYIDSKDDSIVGNANSNINQAFRGFDLSLKNDYNSKSSLSTSENSPQLERRIEKMDNELAVMKNILMQIVINTNQVNAKDIELVRYDLSHLREDLKDMRDYDEMKKIKEEIANIKYCTELLVNAQKSNNEKIRKFIENYYRQKVALAKKQAAAKASAEKAESSSASATKVTATKTATAKASTIKSTATKATATKATATKATTTKSTATKTVVAKTPTAKTTRATTTRTIRTIKKQ
jgi:capsular exopolysaccharide synthesis family protein